MSASPVVELDSEQEFSSANVTLRKETIEGIVWSLPYLAVFTVFLIWPALKGLYMSLHTYPNKRPHFSTDAVVISATGRRRTTQLSQCDRPTTMGYGQST